MWTHGRTDVQMDRFSLCSTRLGPLQGPLSQNCLVKLTTEVAKAIFGTHDGFVDAELDVDSRRLD